MNENYGNLNQLNELGKNKKHSLTFEQLKDRSLKNSGGESNEEVSIRMKSFLNDIINNYDCKKIAVISHGASIKFLLSNYCELDNDMNLLYNNTLLNVNSPSVFNIKIRNNKITDIIQLY